MQCTVQVDDVTGQCRVTWANGEVLTAPSLAELERLLDWIESQRAETPA